MCGDQRKRAWHIGKRLRKGVFYALHKSLTRKGNAQQKLRTWYTVIVAIMTHGCRTWHMTRDLLCRARAWELKFARKMLKLRPVEKLGEHYAVGLSYNARTAEIFDSCCKQHGIKTLPQRILEQLHGAAWREEAGKGRMSELLRGARDWNSESNHVIFGQLSHANKKKMGFIRRTMANAVPRWEGPMVRAWGGGVEDGGQGGKDPGGVERRER